MCTIYLLGYHGYLQILLDISSDPAHHVIEEGGLSKLRHVMYLITSNTTQHITSLPTLPTTLPICDAVCVLSAHPC